MEEISPIKEILYNEIKKGLRLNIPTKHGRSTALIEMIEKLTLYNANQRPKLNDIIVRIAEILQFHHYRKITIGLNRNINENTQCGI